MVVLVIPLVCSFFSTATLRHNSLSHSFICSLLAEIELRHGSLSPLIRSCTTKLLAPIADQLQLHLVHEWITAWTNIKTWDPIDTLLVKLKYCTTRTSIIQLSLPTTTTTIPPTVSTNSDHHQLSLLSMTTTSRLYYWRLFHQLSPLFPSSVWQ